MLRISKKADYAVFLLGAIARQGAFPGGPGGDAVVSAHEIARQAGLNKSVVANLLKEFARHNLLESVRGLRGGYRLVRPPAQISLGEILEVVEGPFTLVDCIDRERAVVGSGLLPQARSSKPAAASPCSLIAFCPSKNPMRVVHERIADLFRRIRLDELCALAPPAAASASPRSTPAPVR
ncbi:MAG: Rrf2 family transcriptional regulator [Planctomycetes bacterium]|nr:Rrf2 family transcriptional regulator [Planctomycetota bacterium]